MKPLVREFLGEYELYDRCKDRIGRRTTEVLYWHLFRKLRSPLVRLIEQCRWKAK